MMEQHFFWLCVCLETAFLETREQNTGGKWGLLILWMQGSNSEPWERIRDASFQGLPGQEV